MGQSPIPLIIIELERKNMQNSTYVRHNNEIKRMSTSDIFDSRKFNTIKAITFSGSRSFIVNTFFNYTDIELIVGISNQTVQNIVYNSFCDLTDYHRKHNSIITMPNDTRKFIEANCRIPVKGVIHSKLYLLSGPDNYRTIQGSANMSKSAFNNESNQFENIIITDGYEAYKKNLSYYNELRDKTMPYVDSETKKQLKRYGYFKT